GGAPRGPARAAEGGRRLPGGGGGEGGGGRGAGAELLERDVLRNPADLPGERDQNRRRRPDESPGVRGLRAQHVRAQRGPPRVPGDAVGRCGQGGSERATVEQELHAADGGRTSGGGPD